MVRKMLGPHKILGVSVKTPAEAAKALADGADYIGVGAVYPTGTKAASVIGVEGLRAVCETSGLPVVAIGGVGMANAAEVLGAGAQGLAVVSAVFAAPDVQVATRQLWDTVMQAQQQGQGKQQQQEENEAEAAADVSVAVGQ
jgi:thiamine-phosphate diphosphorylase